MAVRTRDELTEMLQQRFGESENDEDISFVEDITDTYNSLAGNDQSARITELENELAEQKKKYRDRFFAPAGESGNDNSDEREEEKKKPMRFEDLFKEV